MAESTPVIAYVLAGIFAVVLLGFGGLLLAGNLLTARDRATLAWQVIDAEGRPLTPPRFDDATPFSDGLAAVEIDGAWGYVDTSGNWVIEPRFTEAGPFTEGRAGARDPDSGQWGVIDRSGAWVHPPELDRVGPFVDGVAVASRQVGVETSRITSASPMRSSGLMARDGSWIVEPRPQSDPARWRSARGPDQGRVIVELKEGWRLFGVDGEPIPHEPFVEARAPSGGRIAFSQDRTSFGYADVVTGAVTIPARFRWAEPFQDGRAAVGAPDGRAGWIDADGVVLHLGDYLDARAFVDGRGPVRVKGRGWGALDASFAMAVPPRWRSLSAYSEGRAVAEGDDGFYLIDSQGEVVAGPFAALTEVAGGAAMARVPRP